jgi:hypothetical protein
LRTAIITAHSEEQLRSRAYAMGVDLFLGKPATPREIASLLDCIESLLNRQESSLFRGVENKKVAEMIQVEALSKSSSTLRVRRDGSEGMIWLDRGEIVDASFEGLEGEAAFQRILGMNSGAFEIMAAEGHRPRRIQRPAAALIEEYGECTRLNSPGAMVVSDGERPQANSKLSKLTGAREVEFALLAPMEPNGPVEQLGIDRSEAIVKWLRKTAGTFENLAKEGDWGPLQQIEAIGSQRHFHAVVNDDYILAAAMSPSLTREQALENMQQIIERWAS